MTGAESRRAAAVNGAAGTDRTDFDAIARWIRPGSRVLDLGCGDGALLAHLARTCDVRGYGVEIEPAKLIACAANGINVIQADLEDELDVFTDGGFDHVVLSRTLQAMRNTEGIVREMLRVAREAIVTFPNFGFWRYRLQVALGHMPVDDDLPYQWYETPNIHLCTISDFETFCHHHGVRILERLVIGADGRPVGALPNLLGMLAMYRLGRQA